MLECARWITRIAGDAGKDKETRKKKTLAQRSYSIYRLKLPYSFDHESHFFIINRVAWKFKVKGTGTYSNFTNIHIHWYLPSKNHTTGVDKASLKTMDSVWWIITVSLLDHYQCYVKKLHVFFVTLQLILDFIRSCTLFRKVTSYLGGWGGVGLGGGEVVWHGRKENENRIRPAGTKKYWFNKIKHKDEEKIK